jgi:hypothetical protein
MLKCLWLHAFSKAAKEMVDVGDQMLGALLIVIYLTSSGDHAMHRQKLKAEFPAPPTFDFDLGDLYEA